MRQQLGDMTLPAEDGPSSVGISRRITFTGMAMGMLSGARLEWPQTGHADPSPKRTPEGYPFLCTGEILLAMIHVYRAAVMGVDAAAGPQVLTRLGIDLPRAYDQALELVRAHRPTSRRMPLVIICECLRTPPAQKARNIAASASERTGEALLGCPGE